ncbi:unnamed protein product [Rhizoctonia solani]|uniref:Peptidase S8/S53 domain-containing protein n=1 Tax=Rhizoctonia solani TaxID=456999 RepID=A0A8H2WZR1_9AGAM|nr:unnamed protein product [Rhizoctonia solani]
MRTIKRFQLDQSIPGKIVAGETGHLSMCTTLERAYTQHILHLAAELTGALHLAVTPTPTETDTTHASLAGIAVGTMYGIATQANIYAVKSMSDSGSGAISDIIAGINWVISSVKTSSRPSVVMLGAGGSVNTALDAAVVSATSQGIHFIVPAPTSNAGTSSPARVVSAVTVDVVGQSYTSGVDVCSKGTAVPCPSIQGPTASMTISAVGAAMARVAGIVASVLGTYGNASPASIETALKTHTSTTTNGCLVINTPW